MGSRFHNENHKIVTRLQNSKDSEVHKYIEDGGDVNIQDDYNMTLLHHAVETRNLPRVQLLVEAKCNMNLMDKQDNTALMMSVQRNHYDIAKFLLEKGAKTQTFNTLQNTALSMAVWNRNRQMVDILMTHGADCNTMCNVYIDRLQSSSPVIYCVRHKYFDILEVIESHGKVNLSQQLLLCHDVFCLMEFTHFLSRGADPFRIVNFVPTYDISQIRHVFDKVLISVMQNHHIFGFGAKTCQAVISEYGHATSNYHQNGILQTLFTCRVGPGPSAQQYYERFYANFVFTFLKYITQLGISYQNYYSFCRCLSDFHDRASCNVISKLRTKLKESNVKRDLLQGFVIPLQYQCRRQIRVSLGLGVCDKISKLPLPIHTKSFLRFSDELEMSSAMFCGKAQ